MRLSRLFPSSFKRKIDSHIRAVAPRSERSYFPSHPGEDSYCVKATLRQDAFPIPPKALWLGYGPDAVSYLSGGRENVLAMVTILKEGGLSVESATRILEFGCAAGRMLRHWPEFTKAQLWGVDISAEQIQWCVENLTPAMHFATTTTVPHLPFEDRFFDLVYCGSVFTHIEDLQQSWLLELARILRPSGMLYVTIHDEHTVGLFDTESRDQWLAMLLRDHPIYSEHKDDFNMMVIDRGPGAQIFYNSAYFKSILPPCLHVALYTREAYGYQSALLLEKTSL